MTRKALTSSGVQVTRECVSTIIRRQAKRMVDAEEAAKQRQREYDAKYHYDGEDREVIVCLVHRAGVHPRTGKALFTASMVQELPRGVGLARSTPDEERFLESTMRFTLAHAYLKAGICKDYDDARARIGKARILLEKAYGHGSAMVGATGGEA